MTTEGRAAAKLAEKLIENALAALNAIDPAGIMAVIGADPDEPWPEADEEQRIEAEEIGRRIREQERDGSWLTERAVAKIVRSVCEEWFEVRVARRDAKRTAELLCARRVYELIGDTVADEAAVPLAEGRARLCRIDDRDGSPAVELTPARETAAKLVISIDYDAQVTCQTGERGFGHEIYNPDPPQLADEVRLVVRALLAGTFVEEEGPARHSYDPY